MVISSRVQSQLFRSQPTASQARSSVIRLPLRGSEDDTRSTKRLGTPWSEEEHDRFLRGLELFPKGPWKDVAAYVGTRTARQTMTHAQKYRQKIERCKPGRSIPNATAKQFDPTSPVQAHDLEYVTRPQPIREPLSMLAHELTQHNPANAGVLEEVNAYEGFLIDEDALSSLLDELPSIDIITDRPFDHTVLSSTEWEDSTMWLTINSQCV